MNGNSKRYDRFIPTSTDLMQQGWWLLASKIKNSVTVEG